MELGARSASELDRGKILGTLRNGKGTSILTRPIARMNRWIRLEDGTEGYGDGAACLQATP
jgi:hypothetical protein